MAVAPPSVPVVRLAGSWRGLNFTSNLEVRRRNRRGPPERKGKGLGMNSSDDSRKRQEDLKKANGLTVASILRIKNSLPALSPRAGAVCHVPGREKEPVNMGFQELLAEARRQLAKLLRDVNSARQAQAGRSANGLRGGELLMRVVHCAATQYMLQTELENLALKDELTGLHNRRGFHVLAQRQLKLGRRSGRGMLLFFIDVDGLKAINDSLGHAEGDRVLKRTGEILKKTFRDSDIVARLGGDEFAVLAIEASGHSESAISARLQRYLRAANAREAGPSIFLSVGLARFDHGNLASIAELLAQADLAMYRQKWSQMNFKSIAAPRNFSCCETGRSSARELRLTKTSPPARAAQEEPA